MRRFYIVVVLLTLGFSNSFAPDAKAWSSTGSSIVRMVMGTSIRFANVMKIAPYSLALEAQFSQKIDLNRHIRQDARKEREFLGIVEEMLRLDSNSKSLIEKKMKEAREILKSPHHDEISARELLEFSSDKESEEESPKLDFAKSLALNDAVFRMLRILGQEGKPKSPCNQECQYSYELVSRLRMTQSSDRNKFRLIGRASQQDVNAILNVTKKECSGKNASLKLCISKRPLDIEASIGCGPVNITMSLGDGISLNIGGATTLVNSPVKSP